MTTPQRSLRLVLTAVASAAVVVYVVARAVRVSMTYDEAATYLRYIASDPLAVFRFDVATNHFLNTVLVRLSALAFGDSELALRLPNVLGCLIYIVFSIRTLRLVTSPPIALSGFLLLHLNPYVLEFFSLSRGYGLSLGLLAAGLFYLTRLAISLRTGEGDARDVSRALGWSGAAVLANFSLLTVYVAMFATLFAALAIARNPLKAPGAAAGRVWPWLLVAGTFTFLVLSQDLRLTGRLYEPVSVRLHGVTDADLGAVTISQLNALGRAANLSRQPGSPVWISERTHVASLRIDLPRAAVDRLERIEVLIGDKLFSDRDADWRSHDLGSSRIYESTPSLSLPSARVPGRASIINWRSDRRYLQYVALYTAAVLAILGLLWLLLKGIGMVVARARLLPPDQWRALATSLLWVATFTATPIYLLMRNDELYYGGPRGFVEDSLHSLVQNSFYGREYHPDQVEIATWSVLGAVAGLGVWLYVTRRRQLSASALPAACLLAIALLSAAIVQAQHYLFGTPYPLGRTALFLIPLVILFTTFALDALAEAGIVGKTMAAIAIVPTAAFAAYHFFSIANASSSYEWPRDASTKTMIADLRRLVATERPGTQRVVLGVDWVYSAAAHFYAIRGGPPAIDVVVVPPADKVDFFYGHNVAGAAPLALVKAYPAAESLLARRIPAR